MTDGYVVLQASQWAEMQSTFQMYQIAAVLIFFAIIGVIILFKDAFPFVWARFISHNVVVGVLDKSTRKIICNKDFRKINGVFYYKGEALPFVKVYPGNYFFAGYPFDILDVDLAVITDPRYRKMCRDLMDAGYRDINALEKALQFSMMTRDDPRIVELMAREHYVTYEEAAAAINPAKLTVEHALIKEFFTSIPLSEMLGYGTSVPSDDILGEVDDVYEARKPSMRVKRDIAKMVPIAVLIMGACAAAAIAYIMFFN